MLQHIQLTQTFTKIISKASYINALSYPISIYTPNHDVNSLLPRWFLWAVTRIYHSNNVKTRIFIWN